MVLRSLLVCRDPDTLGVFCRALAVLKIEVEVATTAESALKFLERNKFEAIIVDCDDVAGGPEVLSRLQQTPSNRRATAIALINGSAGLRSTFEIGAHLALEKPITPERAAHTLRAAHGFMVTEQRRYFRHAVETQAYLTFGVVKHLSCKVTSISGGGIAVALSEQISPSGTVDVRFKLPGIPEMLEAKGEIAWSNGKGESGIRFIHVPTESMHRLGKWLSHQIGQDDTSTAPAAAEMPNVPEMQFPSSERSRSPWTWKAAAALLVFFLMVALGRYQLPTKVSGGSQVREEAQGAKDLNLPTLKNWRTAEVEDFDANLADWLAGADLKPSSRIQLATDGEPVTGYLLVGKDGSKRVVLLRNGRLLYDSRFLSLAGIARVPKDAMERVRWSDADGSEELPEGDGLLLIRDAADPAAAVVLFMRDGEVRARVPAVYREIQLR